MILPKFYFYIYSCPQDKTPDSTPACHDYGTHK